MSTLWSSGAPADKGYVSVEQSEEITQTPYEEEPDEPLRWRESHEDARNRRRQRSIYLGFVALTGFIVVAMVGLILFPSVQKRLPSDGAQINSVENVSPAVSVVSNQPSKVPEPAMPSADGIPIAPSSLPQADDIHLSSPPEVIAPEADGIEDGHFSEHIGAIQASSLPQSDLLTAISAAVPSETVVAVGPVSQHESSKPANVGQPTDGIPQPADEDKSETGHQVSTITTAEGDAKAPFKPHFVDPVTGRRLHLLLPATEKNEHLCKTLFTAAANGYPSPVLINWGMVPGEGEHMVSHLKKINGVNNYLGSLDATMADDLVLMTDAYDVWFQLPAEVLIARYHEILEMENERIRKQYGPGALENDIRARIVFAPDKGCVGHSVQDFDCWAQPESLLPVDTYGECTDTENGYYERSCFRHRWLNSGVIIGTVSAMLAAFKRAELIAATISPTEWFQSDQRVFGTIFASQEISRQNRTIWSPNWLNGEPSVINMPSPHEDITTSANFGAHIADWPLAKLPPFNNFEFGINIDYLSKLSHTTFSADYEWAWLLYNSTPAGPNPGLGGPKDCKLILKDLPHDIENVQPIKALENTAIAGTWKDVFLYTNLCSGEIPAIIHHNGDKDARSYAWPSLWFTKYWKEILQSLHAQNSHDPTINDGGAASDKGEKLHWKDLCQAYEEPVFAFEQTKFSVPAMRKGAPGT